MMQSCLIFSIFILIKNLEAHWDIFVFINSKNELLNFKSKRFRPLVFSEFTEYDYL